MVHPHRRANENTTNNISTKFDIIPPWCSSGKVSEKRKLSPKWEIQSSYSLRENIWEYLHDGKNVKCCSKRRNRKKDKVKGCQRKSRKTMLILLLIAGLTVAFWKLYPTQYSELLSKIMEKTKCIIEFGWKNSSLSEQCCHKMRHLALELSRAEQIRSIRYRMIMVSARVKPETSKATDWQYITGATATKGSWTVEWSDRVNLWGVIPLWRTASPPDTVLALRRPTPADCWPFRGSSGELHIHLPKPQRVLSMSIEHVRPDTAKSAPKKFIAFGVLINGTLIEVVKNEYQANGPAKQYFPINCEATMTSVIFRVLSNQGNPKYTCIYRVHLHGK